LYKIHLKKKVKGGEGDMSSLGSEGNKVDHMYHPFMIPTPCTITRVQPSQH